MRGLKALREGWDEVQAEEAAVSRSPTIQESVHQFLILYETFAPWLRETEPLFRPEHEAYLAELQERLQRIAEWQREQSEQTSGD